MKNVSREDIAQRTGTSVSTVSRALNNSGYVKKEKKEEILRVASELGYFARTKDAFMQGIKSRQILYYCEDMRNSFNIHFYQGMLDVAQANGYMILVNGAIDFENLKSFFVDGIILPNETVARRYLEEVGEHYQLPIVCAAYSDERQIKRSIPVVQVDMYKAVEQALDYLWSLGHRKIAYGTPFRLHNIGARNYAYRTWMREHALEEYFYSIEEDSEYMDFFELGRRCAYEICASENPPTALLGFNDEFALGALKGFGEKNWRVPEDISIMGIDGIYSRKYVSPLLTTMDMKPEAQGKACMELMMRMLKGSKYKYITRTSFELEVGESTAVYQGGKV